MGRQYYIDNNEYEGRFAEEREIREHYQENIYRNRGGAKIDIQVAGLHIISDGTRAIVDGGENSTMVVSSTGAGKTRKLLMEYMYSSIKNHNSIVCHVTKSDVLQHMRTTLEEEGYKVLVLDFRYPNRGERYNVFEFPAKLYKEGKTSEALQMFKSIAQTVFEAIKSDNDPFWHTTAISLLQGYLELCSMEFEPNEVTLKNVYDVHLQGEEKFASSNIMKEYFRDKQDSPAWKLINPAVNAPAETRSSIFSVFTSGIAEYVQNENIMDMCSNSTFEAEDLLDKTALIIMTRNEANAYKGLISCIIDQIFTRLIDIAEEKYYGKLPRRVDFIVDEFGSLAPITNMNMKITDSRSRNIRWFLVCQSLEQLSLLYGNKEARIIIGNCVNLAYLHSSDMELLKMISERCGTTVDSYTNERRPLVSVERLQHLDKDSGECLMLLDRLHPFITHLPDISKYPVTFVEDMGIPVREKQENKTLDFKGLVQRQKRESMMRQVGHNRWANYSDDSEFNSANKRDLDEMPIPEAKAVLLYLAMIGKIKQVNMLQSAMNLCNCGFDCSSKDKLITMFEPVLEDIGDEVDITLVSSLVKYIEDMEIPEWIVDYAEDLWIKYPNVSVYEGKVYFLIYGEESSKLACVKESDIHDSFDWSEDELDVEILIDNIRVMKGFDQNKGLIYMNMNSCEDRYIMYNIKDKTINIVHKSLLVVTADGNLIVQNEKQEIFYETDTESRFLKKQEDDEYYEEQKGYFSVAPVKYGVHVFMPYRLYFDGTVQKESYEKLKSCLYERIGEEINQALARQMESNPFSSSVEKIEDRVKRLDHSLVTLESIERNVLYGSSIFIDTFERYRKLIHILDNYISKGRDVMDLFYLFAEYTKRVDKSILKGVVSEELLMKLSQWHLSGKLRECFMAYDLENDLEPLRTALLENVYWSEERLKMDKKLTENNCIGRFDFVDDILQAEVYDIAKCPSLGNYVFPPYGNKGYRGFIAFNAQGIVMEIHYNRELNETELMALRTRFTIEDLLEIRMIVEE